MPFRLRAPVICAQRCAETGQFACQCSCVFGTVADVRKALVTVFIFGQALFVFGQEQENKLADRLLRPNMTLSNADQTKHFYSERGQTTSSSARVKTFDTREDTQPKQFPERRSFFA